MNGLPKSALVLGLARSGKAAATALERRGVAVRGVDRELGNDRELGLLDGVEVLVKSPGVPGEHPLVAGARARGIRVWSELELGYRLLEANPILAVTGTNGKTTTSDLLGFMLGATVGGNEHPPLCELEGSVSAGEWIVCEVSSFQLEDAETFRPPVAVLINLEADHLDRHASFEAYRAAKLRIFEHQGPDDTAVVPRAFAAIPGAARRIEFSASDPLPGELRVPGAHNRENAAAATAAARVLGLDDAAIAEALETFAGVPHRLELVAEVEGVRYVNDSKATNVGATLRALASYDEPIVLIAGGRAKGQTFEPVARAASAKVRRALLIGEAAEELAREFGAAGVEAEIAGDLEQAVRAGQRAAESGDIVLLSPACASYDQFRDFEQRGEEFRRLVQNLRA